MLFVCIIDAIRVHTLWRLAKLDPPSDFALPALQIAVIIMTAIIFLFSEFCFDLKYQQSRKEKPVYIDEPGRGSCGTLFFGWLWPLLKFGVKNTLTADDLSCATPRSIATYRMRSKDRNLFDTSFWSGATVHFLVAMLIRLLGAATMLAQPFIINGIVSYLQNDKDKSIGVWLVVAMLFK